MKHARLAKTDHEIHEFLAQRWSPYGFDEKKDISSMTLRSLFEAARWAPSAFNEQPWRFIVARRRDVDEFEKMLSCLVEGNREWARFAPALFLGIVMTRFTRNDKPNGTALHSLGAATAQLTFEAGARGLAVHQMGGIVPERARELYGIPNSCEAITAVAVGYPGEPAELDRGILDRDRNPRTRKKLAEFVFTGSWENPAF